MSTARFFFALCSLRPRTFSSYCDTCQKMNFLFLSVIVIFSVTTSTVTASCNKTVYTEDEKALASFLLASPDFTKDYPSWDANNVSEACCWQPVDELMTPPYLECQETNGVLRVAYLVLSTMPLTGALPSIIGDLTALTLLDLSSCGYEGPIPQSWSQLTSLTKLSIGNLHLNGTLDVLSNLRKLAYLDVGQNSFIGDMDKLPLASLTSLTDLYLNNNNFTGSFPLWFGNSPNLKVIDVSFNTLSQSSLPTDIASWPAGLSSLSALKSNLTGPIPGILASLPLNFLDLSKNFITGSIPAEFGSMNVSSGTSLTLSSNNLTGEIPLDVAAGHFYNFVINFNSFNSNVTSFLKALCTGKSSRVLRSLDMSNNDFTGEIPVEISNCSNLTYISFSFNRMSGDIPAEIGDIAGLANLNLANNEFTGEIPSQLSKLKSIFEIMLFNNRLTGSLPEFSCTTLETLYAYNNFLTGPLPSYLSNCEGLSDVQLQFNNFSGNISVFASKPALMFLNLASNNLSGSIPMKVVWPNLQKLNLSSNFFTGEIPANFGEMEPNLVEIILSFNSLSGGIPPSLFTSRNLSFLDISYNNLNSSLDPSFLQSSSLTTVYIQSNSLFGKLPATCFALSPNLQDLNLQNNKLSGSLPADLSNSSHLGTLNLADNSFSGPLPSLVKLTALSRLNLSSNIINGSIPNLPSGLGTIDMSNNLLTGTLPPFGAFDFLTYIDVSSNQLSGSIASNFSNVAKLMYLDFSQNKFNGVIPQIYYNLTSNLTYFNISNNLLTGQVPPRLEDVSDYSNNLALCGGRNLPSCIQNSSPPVHPSSSHGDNFSPGVIIGIAVGGGILALVILVALFIVLTARVRNNLWDDLEDSLEYSASLQRSFSTSCEGKFYVFQKLEFDLTIDDIIVATENFSDRCLLGRGGFGSVYRASLPSGEEYAVKRLTQGSSQGNDEFQAEISTLGNVRHKNLVTLVASYYDPTSRECLLVYNYLSGGNLDTLLKEGVDWPTRLRVASGVARGLKYLHHDCIPYIIHRDMKPGNIIMDSYMEAHLSDFGLAKVVDMKKTHVSTKLLGTIGYLAPEYAGKGQASTKSDVFAYGVVLLQLVSGKVPTQSQMRQGMSAWAKSTPVDDVIDPSLIGKGEQHRKSTLAVLKLALACTARSPLDRPTMEEVLHTLENLDAFAAGMKSEREQKRKK